jgi:hypothetical protein
MRVCRLLWTILCPSWSFVIFCVQPDFSSLSASHMPSRFSGPSIISWLVLWWHHVTCASSCTMSEVLLVVVDLSYPFKQVALVPLRFGTSYLIYLGRTQVKSVQVRSRRLPCIFFKISTKVYPKRLSFGIIEVAVLASVCDGPGSCNPMNSL